VRKSLPGLHLTDEDYDIWLTWSVIDNGEFFCSCRASDRRDADQMYHAQRSRAYGHIGILPTLVELPHDPYPYQGGVVLGKQSEYEMELARESEMIVYEE
jgi:hypothetical protein